MTDTIEDFDGANIFDIRDVIERVEALEILRQPGPVSTGNPDDEDKAQDDLFAELATLEQLLIKLRGCGGDHQWRGDWYPVTLIRDSYFEDYAREFARFRIKERTSTMSQEFFDAVHSHCAQTRDCSINLYRLSRSFQETGNSATAQRLSDIAAYLDRLQYQLLTEFNADPASRWPVSLSPPEGRD